MFNRRRRIRMQNVLGLNDAVDGHSRQLNYTWNFILFIDFFKLIGKYFFESNFFAIVRIFLRSII